MTKSGRLLSVPTAAKKKYACQFLLGAHRAERNQHSPAAAARRCNRVQRRF